MKRKFACSVLMTAVAIAGTMTGVRAATLDVKTGLWEMTFRTEAHGQLPIPPEMLAKLTPERRAAVEKMMARNTQPRSHAHKECITQEKLDKGEDTFLEGEPGMKCDNKLSRHTRTSVAGTFHCTKGGMQQRGEFTYEAKDREHIAGRMNMSVSDGTRNMTSKAEMSGHWIGAACGNTP